MNRVRMHPLANAAGRLYDAGRVCSSLALLAERGLGEPTARQLEYLALLVGEGLEQIQQAVKDTDWEADR